MDPRFRRSSIFFTLLLVFTFLVNIVPHVSLSYAAAKVTVKSKVNLRSGPGTTYKLVGSVTAGEKLTTLKTDKGWLNIQKANGSKGWIAGWLTLPVSGTTPQPSRGTTPAAGKIVAVKGNYANVRSGPGTSYSKVATIIKGQQFTVVKESKGWYNIKLTNGKTAWVLNSLVQVKAAAPVPTRGEQPAGSQSVLVTASKANVRSGPGTNYAVITSLSKGNQAPLIKKQNGWFNIQLSGGRNGWVIDSLVAIQGSSPPASKPNPVNSAPTPSPDPIPTKFDKKVIITGSPVNIRSGPGINYGVSGTVYKDNLFGLIKESGGWYYIAISSTKAGWVSGTLAKVIVASTVNNFEINYKKVEAGLQVTFSSDVDLTANPREIPEQNGLVLEISNLILPKTEDLVNVNDGGLKAIRTKQIGTGAEVTLEFIKLSNYILIQSGPKSFIVLIPPPELIPIPVDNSNPTFQLTQVQAEILSEDETKVTLQGNGPITYNKQFMKDPNRIIIDLPNYEPGQAIEFLPVNSSVVNQIRVSLFSTVPKVTRVVIDLVKPCGYTITPSFDQNSLTISLSGKSLLAGKKIVIDPGHGDWDPGAVGVTGLKEKEVNLDTANRLVQNLQALGAEVTMTRTNDIFVPLADRAAIANDLGADIFVSVHANSNTNSAIAGTSTYYYAPTDRPDLAGQLDKRRNLAQAVQTEMVLALGRRDIGILQSKFAVLNATKMPSILVETAFLSNAEEETLLADSANRDKFAEAISRGITNYFLSN